MNETKFFHCSAEMQDGQTVYRNSALNSRRKILEPAFTVELTNVRIISPQNVRKWLWMFQAFKCLKSPLFLEAAGLAPGLQRKILTC